ncbi:MAG: septation protein IspZ [Moraxellaceae bacterium]|nr:septation protein IspZ [Moraxellaceae bacterium]
MKLALKAVIALLFLTYPLAIYFGLARFGVAPLAWLLAGLALLRLALARNERMLWPVAALALLLGLASALTHNSEWLRYYPVLMNLASLAVFGWSLFYPPSLIERLARLHEPNLPASGVVWTRGVTQVWCLFFVINGCIAFYTARYASLETWTLYNGLIAYLLMGMLLGGEYLLRQRRRHAT